MVNIAFIGAGSVVFTRQLVADILRFPELTDARFVLHDIDSARGARAAAAARPRSDPRGARGGGRRRPTSATDSARAPSASERPTGVPRWTEPTSSSI